ncbi:MAG: hypothetical protein U0176_26750 [Bacteroidia bacterium]
MEQWSNDRIGKGAWGRQLRSSMRRLRRLVAQQERRLRLMDRDMDTINALRAMIKLLAELAGNEDDWPP